MTDTICLVDADTILLIDADTISTDCGATPEPSVSAGGIRTHAHDVRSDTRTYWENERERLAAIRDDDEVLWLM